MNRLPLAPLEALLVPRLGTLATVARLADYCGVTRQAWQQYRRRGLSPVLADRLAVRCGYHPFEVWGPAFYETPAHLPLPARGEHGRYVAAGRGGEQ